MTRSRFSSTLPQPRAPADIPAESADTCNDPDDPQPFRFRVDPAACDITRAPPPLPPPPSAEIGLVPSSGEAEIAFDPVPRLRRRRNGWSEEAQRAFIAALAACGVVSRAARAVGMSAKSAYRLLDAPGSASFAEAWDQALANGVENLRLTAIDRAMHGAWVPVVRRGQIVRHEHRYNDRMAIALLSGRVRSIVDTRERAASRRKHRLYLACRKAEEQERARQEADVRAAHQQLIDRIEEERLDPRLRPARQPRVRHL